MFNPTGRDIQELKEMVKEMKEMLEQPEMEEIIVDLMDVYLTVALKSKAVDEFNNRYIDKLASAIAKAARNE